MIMNTNVQQKKVYLVTEITLEQTSEQAKPTGMAAEPAVGALCFLPKSLHRLAKNYAKDRDLTAKRFFLETLLIGLEQQGVITAEQRTQALKELPPEYGWKGRKTSDSSPSPSQ